MRLIRSALSLAVGLSAVCAPLMRARSVHAQAWTQIAPVTTPNAREGAVVVYDPVHKEMVLFGGNVLDPSDETWTLDGDVWTARGPSHAPEPRANAYGFWDSERERVVVFGGNAAGQIDRSVIWSWDGSDWSSFSPAESPPPRRDAAVAYDSTRDRIVLFGGVVDGSPDVTLADTWEYDGSTWVDKTPQMSPGDRGAALMGYDPVRQIVVLVNGYSEAQRELRRDTWIYDGSSWTEAPSANAPPGSSLEMLWNPSLQQLMIAGRKETGTLSAWTFDGAAWSEHATSSYSLNGIPEASLAFDGERGVALYLREEGQRYIGYQLDGASWKQTLPVPQPGGIDTGRGALIFDAQAGEPRLFADASGELQAWRWDGIMWRLIELDGARSPNAVARIAYDVARARVVAFDGLTYELQDGAWQAGSSASSPSTSGAMAYDKGNERLVYFGGSIAFARYADTSWTWAGAGWEQLTTAGAPPARRQAALAYDERRRRMVLFGGLGIVDGQQRHLFDTWELNDSSWTQSSAQGPSDLRDSPSLTYDQGRQRIVLWAAQDDEDSKLWEYNGSAWVGTEPPPIAGAAGVVCYDAAGRRLLLHDAMGRTWARVSSGSAPDGPATEPGPGTSDAGSSGTTSGGTHGDDGGGVDPDTAGETPRGRKGDPGCAALPLPARASGWAWIAAIALLCARRRSRRLVSPPAERSSPWRPDC